jgi:hypothetical protein
VFLEKFDDPQRDALVNTTITLALSVAERHKLPTRIWRNRMQGSARIRMRHVQSNHRVAPQYKRDY